MHEMDGIFPNEKCIIKDKKQACPKCRKYTQVYLTTGDSWKQEYFISCRNCMRTFVYDEKTTDKNGVVSIY